MASEPKHNFILHVRAWLERTVRFVLLVASIGGVGAGTYYFGLQGYVFLRTGNWVPSSLLSVFPGPLVDPSWAGLNYIVRAVLDFMPMPVSLVFVSSCLMVAALAGPGLNMELLLKKYAAKAHEP